MFTVKSAAAFAAACLLSLASASPVDIRAPHDIAPVLAARANCKLNYLGACMPTVAVGAVNFGSMCGGGAGLPSATVTTSPPAVTSPPTVTTSTVRTSTSTAPKLCTTTSVTPSTCEYKVGNWCATNIPSWTNKSTCTTAKNACSAQVLTCAAKAGGLLGLNALQCINYTAWCTQMNTHCNSKCSTAASASCGKEQFYAASPQGLRAPYDQDHDLHLPRCRRQVLPDPSS
ncbi:unnamed protein product [Parascedosporium putredinis]|uniref:Uncharacterized protein n=1 Tax=Parascedosporium putredinis TaxID=1442378 RepID=A0A9P1MEM7_9PEZI|nr:unnamed protein product [Parascedosporium putredinis]CAI8000818.1 unnamed protein product [Parascedosporium putredinis]